MSQHEQWQIRDTAPEAYERYFVPTIFIPWTEDLLARAALQPGERVLDVACGTGIVARRAAQQVGSTGTVVGVDLNPEMLEVARAQTPTSGAPVVWRQGDAGALPCPDATFDVVCCQQGLQFFPDKVGALRQMHRVLVPGGRLALSVVRSLEHNPLMRTHVDAVEHHLSAEAAASWHTVCGLGDAEELRRLLGEAGFQNVRMHIVMQTLRHPNPAEFISGGLMATPLAGAIAALDAPTRTALLRDILDNLRPYIDDEGLACPHEAHVVVAHTEP
jgi:ubiquinone/menaquinone biosynthesis C-methylase UbiE